MGQFKKDLLFGKQAEKECFEKIKQHFKKDIEISKYEYSKYDFVSDDAYYELKSRNNAYNAYPTTIIARDKIIQDCTRKQYFIFNFTDGIYYIRYRPKRFKKFEVNNFRREDRGDIDKLKPYIFIPIEKLKKIL